MRAHAFMPLDPRADVDQAHGWVSILDGDDTDLEAEKLFFAASGGEQLRVTLRADVLKAPSGEVRRQVQARIAALEATEGRPVSRHEKRALQEEVARTLRLRAFPRVRLTDVVWDLDGKRLYLWSQSKATNELFIDLFTRSFGLKIEVEGAARWAHAVADPKKVSRLEPTRELWTGFSGVRPLAVVAPEDV